MPKKKKLGFLRKPPTNGVSYNVKVGKSFGRATSPSKRKQAAEGFRQKTLGKKKKKKESWY